MLHSNIERFYDLLAVKHDCVFGEDLDLSEITYVSEVFFSFHFLTFITTACFCINARDLYIFTMIIYKLIIRHVVPGSQED